MGMYFLELLIFHGWTLKFDFTKPDSNNINKIFIEVLPGHFRGGVSENMPILLILNIRILL